MKKNSVESAVRYFILIVVKVKERSESSQRFSFNGSEVKQRSECSQWKKNNVVSVVNENKSVVSVVRYFILIVVK